MAYLIIRYIVTVLSVMLGRYYKKLSWNQKVKIARAYIK